MESNIKRRMRTSADVSTAQAATSSPPITRALPSLPSDSVSSPSHASSSPSAATQSIPPQSISSPLQQRIQSHSSHYPSSVHSPLQPHQQLHQQPHHQLNQQPHQQQLHQQQLHQQLNQQSDQQLPDDSASPQQSVPTDQSSRISWRGVMDSARLSAQSFVASAHTPIHSRERSTSALSSFEPPVRVSTTTKQDLDAFFAKLSLYVGELPVAFYPADFVNDIRGSCIHGHLYLTTYRLGFFPNDSRTMLEIDMDFATVPLCSINRVEKIGARKVNHNVIYALDIICKDFRDLRFLFYSDPNTRREAHIKISQWAFPMSSDLRFFSFDYQPDRHWDAQGWTLYNPIREYSRIGIPSDSWRIATINCGYKICDTYPELIVVPAVMSDDELVAVAAFRSRGRIPALSWIHPKNKASITRCSQPRVGMSGKRSREDEKLVEAISQVNPKAKVLYILDSRPKANAFGNQVKGAGFENTSNYRNISLSFMGIENIHVMRDSLTKLRQVCLSYGSKTLHLHYNQNTSSQDTNISATQHWYSLVHDTQWLTHIKIVLLAAVRLIRHVTDGDSVMIHCSDGWDRTAQQSSLAMMCMDPYYRTIEGFMILLEKEWCSFGHKFTQRIGHGDDKHTDDQRAPIFLQFIDCVWQISRQYPHIFQFNELMLVHILDHLFSCRFGTFLCNSEKESISFGIRAKTHSLWSFLLEHRKLYTNPKYTGPTEFSPDVYEIPPIFPNPHSVAVALWTNYYMRWTSHAPFLETPCPSEFFDHESFEYRKQMIAEARRYQMTRRISGSEASMKQPTAPEASSSQNEKKGVDKDTRIQELESKLSKLQEYLQSINISIPEDFTADILDENEKSAIEDTCRHTEIEESENATRVDQDEQPVEIETVADEDIDASPTPVRSSTSSPEDAIVESDELNGDSTTDAIEDSSTQSTQEQPQELDSHVPTTVAIEELEIQADPTLEVHPNMGLQSPEEPTQQYE
eukprot:TRINITY_DN2177_c0_g3_i1.p1 TRINITY_DN2177_c0_g3~~TRINITY_DN2177_c0_g3_i1.p1  ORF type:complete len:975 (-),score=191.01 TRINITY_DN2177_c0_g3_i1:483-3407(-)